ncbi:hypothetical protein R1sor_007124 [Riccia sorocarpa]|uniref:Transmembrane protein n=1 Tax=Riccia sorocarpa TaxID=122646 RepID=A0ABD3HPY4_9MARC
MSSSEGAPAVPQGDGNAKQGVTINNLIEDSSMCLLLLSLWLCVVGVMLRNLYEECRLRRNFSQAGFSFTCLLIGIGGGYGAALAFNSYDERIDLVYIGYVTISGFALTFLVMVVIMAEFCWWKMFHGGDWTAAPEANEDGLQESTEPGSHPHGPLLGKSGSFNVGWVADWVRGGPRTDREYKDYQPVHEGVELRETEAHTEEQSHFSSFRSGETGAAHMISVDRSKGTRK